jgi:hypothetical protein
VAEASSWFLQLTPADNSTLNLNCKDEGWYVPASHFPGGFAYSAFRIKNVIVAVEVSYPWAAAPPSALPEGWFKALLDAQIDKVGSASADPSWNSNTSSVLMVSYDDLNRTDPNAWRLTHYFGTDGRYNEGYSSGWDTSETILKLELT